MNAGISKKIKKAVIPIAGAGTRMFPETLFIKKVLLPVPDDAGVIKPALLYMLEELSDCGIEEIFLIVGEGEQADYERVLKFEFDTSFEQRLPERTRRYYKRIHELGEKVRFVVQKEKKGFGHAVYQARQYLNEEPCVLLLGDFLYRSDTGVSCTQQTIDAFDSDTQNTVIGIRKIDLNECVNYGTMHGAFRKDNPIILDADAMVEKPSVEKATNELLVNGECYATFGSYILTDDIFEYVGKQIEEKERTNDPAETDLTSAFADAAGKGKLTGVIIEGQSFDVGLPEMYRRTFDEFGKK